MEIRKSPKTILVVAISVVFLFLAITILFNRSCLGNHYTNKFKKFIQETQTLI
jgi:hypothetical protein